MLERQTDRQTGFLEVVCLGKARVSPFLHNNRVICIIRDKIRFVFDNIC